MSKVDNAEFLTEHGITVKQERVAEGYALGKSITELAAAHDVARSTIYAWLKGDRAFVAYYKSLLMEVRQEVRGAISSMAAEAVSTLKELMAEGGEQAKLKAATYVLDKLTDDEKRIAKAKEYGGKKR